MQSATLKHKNEDNTMARRKRQAKTWVEPKRKGAPTLTARAVAKELDFSIEMVHVLVRRGPELDGIAAYIPAENGRGWVRKRIPTKAEREQMAAAGKPYNSHAGVQLFFYEEDIKAWNDAHPILNREQTHIPYTPQERDLVIQEAEQIKDANGHVNRTRLLEVLARKHNLHWGNGKNYQKFSQILDNEGYKLPMGMRRDTRVKRKYRVS